MNKQDYEIDNENGVSQMKRTSPGGLETTMTAYKPCDICGQDCLHKADGKCYGEVTRNRNMLGDLEHQCEYHKTPPGRYYESEPTEKDGPLQRMIS